MEVKQTSVEWLVEDLIERDLIKKDDYIKSFVNSSFEKAKQMEKQQIIDAFEQGEYTGRGFEDLTSEEYYNINFKSE